MDKFGIFNLINSFLTDYKSKNPNPQGQKPLTPSEKPTTSESVPPEPAPYIPLRAEMLKTIKDHDLFVKRVLKDKK